MPSGPAGQALVYCEVWTTQLFKSSSYVENKKVREKKIKKITQKIFFIFIFRNARVVSRAIWKFHPVLSNYIINFFFLSNNSTNWRHPCRTTQSCWPPDKTKQAAEKIDIVAIKTTEISPREKKTK